LGDQKISSHNLEKYGLFGPNKKIFAGKLQEKTDYWCYTCMDKPADVTEIKQNTRKKR